MSLLLAQPIAESRALETSTIVVFRLIDMTTDLSEKRQSLGIVPTACLGVKNVLYVHHPHAEHGRFAFSLTPFIPPLILYKHVNYLPIARNMEKYNPSMAVVPQLFDPPFVLP